MVLEERLSFFKHHVAQITDMLLNFASHRPPSLSSSSFDHFTQCQTRSCSSQVWFHLDFPLLRVMLLVIVVVIVVVGGGGYEKRDR